MPVLLIRFSRLKWTSFYPHSYPNLDNEAAYSSELQLPENMWRMKGRNVIEKNASDVSLSQDLG